MYFIGSQPFRALYLRRKVLQGISWMLNPLSVIAKVVLIIGSTAAIVAFVAFSPIIFCHGGGAGGNCGEGFLASLPLAFVLTPVPLIFGTIFFFPSTKKALFIVLAILAAITIIPPLAGQIVGTAVQSYRKGHPTKAMQERAVHSYKYCLDSTARGRAQFSEDQPQAIEHLSLDKCSIERQALFDDYQIDLGTVATLEHEFQINLQQLMEDQRHRFPKRT
jgi:hypothetical protein